jgi:hypothetical protein
MELPAAGLPGCGVLADLLVEVYPEKVTAVPLRAMGARLTITV